MSNHTTKPEKTAADSATPSTPAAITPEEPATEKELHAHDHGSQTLEQNHRAEQQLKSQQQAQNGRELFPKGLAQEHGKGRG